MELGLEQLGKISEKYGPSGLALVIFLVIAWRVFIYFRGKDRLKFEQLVKNVSELSASVQALTIEFRVIVVHLENTKAEIQRSQGVQQMQQATLQEHIRSLGGIDAKLGALFKYVDAPKRATDGAIRFTKKENRDEPEDSDCDT